MALQGCCCCGLRGGAKAVGVFFLIVSLMMLIGVIVAWAVCYSVPTDRQGFGVDTPEGRFGLSVSESKSLRGDHSGGVQVNLGKLGSYGATVNNDGHWSLKTPGGELSPDKPPLVPGLSLPRGAQIALIASTVYVLLAVSFNSLLIHGAEYDSSCAVLAWLVFYGIHFVLHSLSAVIGVIGAGIAYASAGQDADPLLLPGLVGAGVAVPISALLWFWWALVLTFYREVRDGTRGFKYQRDVSMHDTPTLLVAAVPHAAHRKAEECA